MQNKKIHIPFKTLEENQIALLKEDNKMLTDHLIYLRSLVKSKELKLKRNDDLLKFYIEALSEYKTKVCFNTTVCLN
jgi:hypothetical protein